jgi:GTP-binding protein YchF
VEFLDIAGLVKGASRGEGLGNKFLSHIRSVDAVVHVIRCFDDLNVTHVEGASDPLRDIGIINTELILSDLEYLGRQLEKAKKLLKGDKSKQAEVGLLERLEAHLDGGKPARTFLPSGGREEEILSSLELLTGKPVLYVANMDEEGFRSYGSDRCYTDVLKYAEAEGSEAIPVCAKLEEEIASLDEEDRELFLRDLGQDESGLERLVRKSYRLLGLISFLTTLDPEVRAWTIREGTRAPKAAGKIHSDFERGFIRAEVVSFEDLVAAGSVAKAREKGLYRSEGKDYVMRDGDVVQFRFNV